MEDMRTCTRCGKTKLITEFTKHGSYRGVPYRDKFCSECYNEDIRRKRLKSEDIRLADIEKNRNYTQNHKQEVNAHARAYYKDNPARARAREAVKRALEQGRLKPQPCARCGKLNVDAHHTNGYSKEHQLDIVWLCRWHHHEAHREMRKEKVIV